MQLFAGKTPTERNKIIAAAGLGTLSLIALFWAFGPSFGTGAKVIIAPTPSPAKVASSPKPESNGKFNLPSDDQQIFTDSTTEIVYRGMTPPAPDAGRNIFAFYEPPPPGQATPVPIQTKTPTPTPTPPVQIAYVMPQNVYAGSAGFRMEINGDRITPDLQVYFNQSQMPTTYVSPQKLVTEIPAALIASEGQKDVLVQSPDGKIFSNRVYFNVQAPPRPQFTYVGMIARKRYNNDTAYFMEQGKQLPTAARLNDVVSGRFRLMSISSEETVVEDVNLGFRYKLALVKTGPPSVGPSGGFPGSEFSNGPTYTTPGYPNPNMPGGNVRSFPQQQSPQMQQQVPPRQRPRDVDPVKDKDKDTNDDDTDN